MIGIKAKIMMERTLYLDLPEDTKKEDIIETANKEIILPTDILSKVSEVLSKLNVKISNLDISDWTTQSIEYEIL